MENGSTGSDGLFSLRQAERVQLCGVEHLLADGELGALR